ncbi:hypothetical protein [Fontibacillus sp. BL9]|uniref:hypothetical protein n=1 Tax=Fontibacillus sp. BL9 TaxID=3389971 RepID=UPI003979CF6D
MAFDLVAKLKLQDNFSDPMRKVERQTKAAQKSMDSYKTVTAKMDKAQTGAAKAVTRTDKALARVKTATQKAGSAFTVFGKNANNAMNRAARGTGGLVRSIGGVAAAYMGARAAKSAWDRTIGAAAEYEMREVTVKAMFGGDYAKNAQKYLDFVEGRAAVSQYTTDDFLTAGKSFIPTTKDNDKLAKMVNLAERLGAIDPDQGITGAAFALKEFFSGDAVSLVERFELPRKVMNDLKNLSLDKQLKELDKYLNQIGATNELIEAQAATATGEWRKSTAKLTKALREMGMEGLEKIKPLLRDFNKWLESPNFQKFKEAGVKAFSGLFEAATNTVRKVANYLDTNLFSNPAFQQIPTIEGKVKYVFDTLQKDFDAWWNAAGKTKIEGIAQELTNTLGNALKASQPILDAATKIGSQIGKSILSGIGDSLVLSQADNPLDKFLSNLWGEEAWGIGYDENGKPYKYEDKAAETVSNISNPAVSKYVIDNHLNRIQLKGEEISGSHAGGLDRVPYNGYTARLHRDETVLTRTEAQEYRENQRGASRGSRGGNVIITGNTFHVREDADIDRIARQLAYVLTQ